MRKLYTTIMLIVFMITLQGQNKLLSSTDEYLSGSSWIKNSAINYEYDANNNLTTATEFSWNSNLGKWENSYLYIYAYNANNKITQELSYTWDLITKKYINKRRVSYSYNGIGNITGVVEEDWKIFQFINDYKTDFSYNANNLLTSYISYSWNGAQWVNSDRGTLIYNANNRVASEADEEWNGALWVNSYRDTFTYNGNKKLITAQYDDWNGAAWESSSTDNYNFDSFGNRIIYSETYSGGQYKNEYAYDTSVLMSGLVHPFKDKTGLDYLFEDFPYVNKLLAENQYNYDTATSSYILSNRTTYSYTTSITLGIEKPEIANNNITVFPNPTTSIINLNSSNEVSIDKVVVFDVTGRIVLQQEGSAAQINVEKLTPGLYILEAYFGKEKFTSKFIKK